jgi:hypothetical protein
MKRITIKWLLPALVLASATACHGDLDIIQDNKLSASNMWTDSNDVTTSTYGIYYRMRANFVQDEINVFYWGEARVGDYMWGPSLESRVQNGNMIDVRHSTMSASTTSTGWSALYTAIDQANAVLKYAPQIAMTDSDRGFAIGQAAFARAYCYFWAARLWGDVPLNLKPIEGVSQEETYPTRAPKASVYAQIGEDINTALENGQYLGTDKYLATLDAVNMLKAEYGLWMYTNQQGGDSYLDLAEEALSAIGISSSRLLSDYASVFSRTNKRNAEVVFALNNNQTEKLLGGYYYYFCHPSNLIASAYRQNPVPIISTQWWSYSQEFVDVLLASKTEHGDRRVDCNLGYGEYGASGQTISWPNKFLGDMSVDVMVRDCDLLYYRYALAVMMDAECKYYRKNYSGALTSLNLIAKRAYGVDNFYTDASADAVLQALTDEYFLEFPCEGVIWWALIRLDKIWEYNPDLDKDHVNILLWPISASARNKNNKLEQTEGWS